MVARYQLIHIAYFVLDHPFFEDHLHRFAVLLDESAGFLETVLVAQVKNLG